MGLVMGVQGQSIAAHLRGRGRNNSLLSHLRSEFLTRTRSTCSVPAAERVADCIAIFPQSLRNSSEIFRNWIWPPQTESPPPRPGSAVLLMELTEWIGVTMGGVVAKLPLALATPPGGTVWLGPK